MESNNEKVENKRIYLKYDEENIYRIIRDYVANSYGFGTFSSRIVLFNDKEGLRAVCVIGDEEDEEIYKLDFDELDRKLPTNQI
jgi:hypothetical protein